MTQYKPPGIHWTTIKNNVDIETGEKIKDEEAKNNYIKIKTEKHVSINHIKTRGIITLTNQYKRNPQTKLF